MKLSLAHSIRYILFFYKSFTSNLILEFLINLVIFFKTIISSKFCSNFPFSKHTNPIVTLIEYNAILIVNTMTLIYLFFPPSFIQLRFAYQLYTVLNCSFILIVDWLLGTNLSPSISTLLLPPIRHRRKSQTWIWVRVGKVVPTHTNPSLSSPI